MPRSILLRLAPALAGLLLAPAAAHAGCWHQECYEKVRTPDVYARVVQPVVVAPARVDVYRTPAVYGAVAREVEVAPARAWTSYTPAVYGTVSREVVVSQAGWRWQRTVDWRGRERMCRVAVPAVTRRVHERVLLEPGRRVTHVAPAITRTVYRDVLVEPAHTHRVWRPALVGYAHRNVLVRRGGHHWQRSW